tara:strand:- start:7 stop:378 length:372 start_codon:yes stop_codon:yes gene_type:complete
MEIFPSINVYGKELEECCGNPATGFLRNGKCDTCPEDRGLHTVCILATNEFLIFSQEVGNDLSTPHPEFNFPGLKAGNKWCLCALRWKEAYRAGKAPPVFLESTHKNTLELVDFNLLQRFAVN